MQPPTTPGIEPGAITRFSTGEPQHECGARCNPDHPRHLPCFKPVPYEPKGVRR